MSFHFGWRRVAFAAFIALMPASASAQGVDYLKANYTKTEHMVPMRDGVRLYTALYTPKDASQKYPILMTRTQSGCEPYGADQFPKALGPSAHFAKEGYIFVNQDIRGRWASEGTYVRMRPHLGAALTPNPSPKGRGEKVDESSDTYDTIDWLLKNVAKHNGKVGYWGMSYRGWLVAAGMLSAHPALVAASPQAPVMDTFVGDDWRHNGATFLMHAFYYAHRQGVTNPKPTREPFYLKHNFDTPDGYDFFLRMGSMVDIDHKYFKGKNHLWNDLLRHPTYDEMWKAHNLRPHLKNIKPALLTVGGWFDAENLFGVLEAHREFTKDKANNVLVMGPWIHGGWNFTTGASLGPVAFGANTAEYYREKIELPFFNHHLKGKGAWKPAMVYSFETGTNRWREFTTWPPREAKPSMLFLEENSLSFVPLPPPFPGKNKVAEFDEFISDPARPVPYCEKLDTRMVPEYMSADQRFASRRPDVLVYDTGALIKPITLAGPIDVNLHVSTSGTDADWIVKLIDVYPNDYKDEGTVKMGGYQQLVRAEVMRGSFRNSLEKREPFEPGKPTAVNFKLQDVHHTFRPGHKIMVQVHSTWFPLVERNPQTFRGNIGLATPDDYRKAVHRVYRSPDLRSQIVVRVLP